MMSDTTPAHFGAVASDTRVEAYDRNEFEPRFREVMRYVTERAWAEGLEEAVMPAIFDVLEEGARRREEQYIVGGVTPRDAGTG
jgi:hypothetical protein